jgi:hypothetical protein
MHLKVIVMLHRKCARRIAWCEALGATTALMLGIAASITAAIGAEHAEIERVVRAYPDHLTGIDGNWLIWRDGTRMAIDDGKGDKDFAAWLADPDIQDMLAVPYPAGADIGAPPVDRDPGRARNYAFFSKMYGDCRTGEVERHLVDVTWLPSTTRQHLRVTRVNGVADRIAQVSRALEALPDRFRRYLVPAAGGYYCRTIAGTGRTSPHGYGIAIDVAVKYADYWRWPRPDAAANRPFRNRIPIEIVQIFEAHGFIWGGRWFHYDTMHFEYRPELLPAPPPGR